MRRFARFAGCAEGLGEKVKGPAGKRKALSKIIVARTWLENQMCRKVLQFIQPGIERDLVSLAALDFEQTALRAVIWVQQRHRMQICDEIAREDTHPDTAALGSRRIDQGRAAGGRGPGPPNRPAQIAATGRKIRFALFARGLDGVSVEEDIGAADNSATLEQVVCGRTKHL